MSFIEFINESEDAELQFIKSTAHQLIDKIRDSKKSKSREYTVFSGMEFTKPFVFDLTLYVRRDTDSNPKHDSHFNSLPWEELNFEMKLNHTDMLVPKIEIHIIINPNTEPICYSKLYYKLIDALAHETNHLDQTGINRDHSNVHVSSEDERKASKKSSKYFILPEEMESNIVGMYTRSQEEDRPLDELFYDYLEPFLKSDYISRAEFNKTMVSWVKKAIELYPNAKFSSNVDNIINSI